MTSLPALRTLGHPDQSVAHLSPSGLTLVWADAERTRIAADAIEMSLAWQLPGLYTAPAGDGDVIPSFRFVRVGQAPLRADDPAVRQLRERRDAARSQVPDHIHQLTQALSEAAASGRKAEERRQELAAVLEEHTATLANEVQARTIVGIQRRIATLELDRKGQTTVDLSDIKRAYEALLDVSGNELPTDPDAARLADQWEGLRADEARLDQNDTRHPLTDQLLALQSKLRLAEMAATAALAEVNRPRPTAADRAEIERLHNATERAEERAARRGAKRNDTQAVEDARAAEAAFLGRFGVESYSEYLLAGALESPAAAVARHEAAEQKVDALKAMIADLQSHMAPSPARQALVERAEQLAAEIAARFSQVDLAGDDVPGALRAIRCPSREWFDLVAALQVAGHDPSDDPKAVAFRVLTEAQEVNRPVDAIDAELADLRAKLAAVDPEAVSRFGSLGTVAAELIKVEHTGEQLQAELGELRAQLGAELEQEPAALAALDTIQTLDRELAALTAANGNGNGGRNGSAGTGNAAGDLPQLLEAAVGTLRVDPGEPVILALEGHVDETAATLAAEMGELVERLVELSNGRQLVVITAIEPLLTAAGERGGVALATFDTP